MSFLIFAAPIIFIIIFAIFAVVFASDSKRYRKNLDNSKQMELDNAREQALKAVEEMKRIKEAAKNGLNDSEIKEKTLDNQQVYKEDIYEQQVDNRTVVNKYQQYYNGKYNRGRNEIVKRSNFNQDSIAQESTKKLEFSKENLVRGIIANEYLNRNTRRGR